MTQAVRKWPQLVTDEPTERPYGMGDAFQARAAGLRPQPPAASSLSSIPIAGPSQRFLELTRKPSLESPKRFEPTVKGENDVVI